MTYEELVAEIRGIFMQADVSSVKEHIAYQFNIEGEAEGAFYVEVADGQLHIEPYEYYDRDVLFTTKADTLLKIATGKLDAVMAFTLGKLKAEGDLDKALLLQKFAGKAGKKAAEDTDNQIEAEAANTGAAGLEKKTETAAVQAEEPASVKKTESDKKTEKNGK